MPLIAPSQVPYIGSFLYLSRARASENIYLNLVTTSILYSYCRERI